MGVLIPNFPFAVRLLESGDKPAVEVAREIGIRHNLLYKWQEQLRAKGDGVFGGAGRPKTDSSKDAEITRIKQELEHVEEERDILKKAAAYFAKEVR